MLYTMLGIALSVFLKLFHHIRANTTVIFEKKKKKIAQLNMLLV